MEAKVDDATADPADETRGVGEVDEPVENDGAMEDDVSKDCRDQCSH